MNGNQEVKSLSQSRIWIIGILIVACCVVMVAKLVNLQVIHGEEYSMKTTKRIVTNGTLYAARGNIFDRNGVPIAGNRIGYYIQYVDDSSIKNDIKNEMVLKLATIFEKYQISYKRSLKNKILSNPDRIEVSDSKSFIKIIKLSDKDGKALEGATPEELYQYMVKKTFGIADTYTTAEKIKIAELRYEILVRAPKLGNPLLLAEDVPIELVAELEEQNSEFKGISTYSKPLRVYYDAEVAAHVLGYVGAIQQNTLTTWNKSYPELNYQDRDTVGRDGIELAAEQTLRGINGITLNTVDTLGRIASTEVVQKAVPGKDLYLTIDLDLQRAATNSIIKTIQEIREKGGKKNFGDADKGAVVAIDVHTGEVLAMANYKSYDPSVFLSGDSADISEILMSKDEVIYNLAAKGTYAPGSTYKPLVAIAALESGSITPGTLVNCPWHDEIEGFIYTNLEGNQGRINLERALETSSNMFFYKTGVATGIDNIVKWAKIFGFGQKTGIEIDESIGSLASREYKSIYKNDIWRPADTCSAALGQLYNGFTPLQIANYVATIANGGKRYTPHLIRKQVSQDGSVIQTEIQYLETGVSESTIKAVKKGMVAVANSNDGTAVNVFRDFAFQVAGKTGTAETGLEANSSSNALFVCYAPADHPEIAVAVVVSKGVWGAYTAPIARDVLMEYFYLKNLRQNSNQEDPTGFDW